jgi:hypothetical protein
LAADSSTKSIAATKYNSHHLEQATKEPAVEFIMPVSSRRVVASCKK